MWEFSRQSSDKATGTDNNVYWDRELDEKEY
jgi:hypothetical protein